MISIIILISGLLTYTFELQAFLWQNFGQVYRLHGDNDKSLTAFQHAYDLAPLNHRIGWQLSEAFIRSGDLATATTILLPMIKDHPPQLSIATELLNSLLKLHRLDDALALYQKLPPETALSMTTAASIAESYIQRQGRLPAPHAPFLVAQALGVNSFAPEFQLISKNLAQPDFWSTRVGKNTRKVFTWRMTPCCHTPRVQKSVPTVEIARMLKRSHQEITLGTELANNGDFEARVDSSMSQSSQVIISWYPSFMTDGIIWNYALFVLGLDMNMAFSGQHAARIDGLMIDRTQQNQPPRAGLWHAPIDIPANTTIVISFVYRTEQLEDYSAKIYITDDPTSLHLTEYALPIAEKIWKQVVIIGRNNNNTPVQIQPLLRSFGEGTVWFDNFSVKPITSTMLVELKDVLIEVSTLE